MYSFRGTHALSIDDKGRVAIPARYRETLQQGCASQLIVTLGSTSCLEIYPADKFAELELEIQAMADRTQASILRNRMIGFADEVELDKQGRFVLPAVPRRRFNLVDSAMLMGQSSHFKLWAEADFEKHLAAQIAQPREVDDAYNALRGR